MKKIRITSDLITKVSNSSGVVSDAALAILKEDHPDQLIGKVVPERVWKQAITEAKRPAPRPVSISPLELDQLKAATEAYKLTRIALRRDLLEIWNHTFGLANDHALPFEIICQLESLAHGFGPERLGEWMSAASRANRGGKAIPSDVGRIKYIFGCRRHHLQQEAAK